MCKICENKNGKRKSLCIRLINKIDNCCHRVLNCSYCQTLINVVLNSNPGLITLYCDNCPLLKNISHINNLKKLYCYNCPQLTDIALIDGLEILACYNCPMLTNIPLINGLEILDCTECNITNIPLIKGLKKLYCSGCPLLTNIPLIKGLKELYCTKCPITDIPLIKELEILDCSYCPYLINISLILKLKKLYCSFCPFGLLRLPKLTKIPYTSRGLLKKLDCSFCYSLTDIPLNKGLKKDCFGCKWINIKNMEYQDNIRKLIKLQNWFKKIIISKRLIRLIPHLIPLYYHPEAKGGYLHKKKILNFIEKLI